MCGPRGYAELYTGLVMIALAFLFLLQPATKPAVREQARSVVMSRYGIVAASQTLAAAAGAKVLEHGGNAVDAAIAANAVLGLVEPTGNGIGGDLFAIVYEARTGKVHGLNSSGWAPSGLTPEFLEAKGMKKMPSLGIHTVTVPGAVAGWDALHRKFGRMTWARLFAPAATYAEEGFPLTELIAGPNGWGSVSILKNNPRAQEVYWPGGKPPKAGDIFRNPLLAKSLRPLPEKFHGLTDQEQKYRARYLDLMMNEDARFTFVARSRILASIRNYMTGHGFLEVETPMMHPIPGGAAAKPFKTHHNALDMELYLRIAPELYLKRLVVGGFEKVFEVNRNFRNEGISTRHNPEFTMMEFYEAYTEYRQLMNFTEGLLRHAAHEALGRLQFDYQGRTLDLGKPFARMTVIEALRKYHPGFTLEQLNDADWLRAKLKALDVEPHKHAGLGSLQLTLFEETTEAELFDPTFIMDYPAEVSPLARRSDANPEITERFELYIAGRETANGFSELNDPEDQAARFLEQVKARQAGDEEAMYYDADYIRALEYGMPPAAGCGVGVDRFVMLLTDAPSIRDVLLFPHMRPEERG